MKGFQIVHTYDLKQGVLWEMEHVKTKAKIAWLDNKEENKVFSIAFKTPPEDGSGVFHVLEHSVLNGSKNYPIKNLFVELMKGSLNTYLNALTFPDKTMYPVASRNEKDFFNLVGVYLDCTLFPMVLTDPHIFEQEHTVVYNEMKGVFSSPEDRLAMGLPKLIFPDIYLGKESGGNPDEIVNLTYDKLKEMHARYYHPTNAYVYLEGDLEIDSMLELLDRYFSCFEKGTSVVYEKQKAVPSSVTTDQYVPFFEDDGALYSCGRILKGDYTRDEYLAFNVLCNYLAGTNESPLKKAVLDSGIAHDMSLMVVSDCSQPYFVLQMLQMDYNRKAEGITLINDTLDRLKKQGINKEELLAEIDQTEYFLKDIEEPAGMARCEATLNGWINYNNPSAGLNVDMDLSALREYVSSNHFNQLIEELKLDDFSEYVLFPEAVAEETMEAEPSQELLEWQNTPVDEKLFALLPKLNISDIKDSDIFLDTVYSKYKVSDVLFHPAKTNEINHYGLYFPLSGCSIEELQIVSLMTNLFGRLPTENFELGQLEKEMKKSIGQVDFKLKIYPTESVNRCRSMLQVTFSTLEKNAKNAIAFISEIMQRTDFTGEYSRALIYQIIMQGQNNLFQEIMAEGSRYAILRSASHLQAADAITEATEGYSFFQYITSLAERFDDVVDELVIKMNSLCNKLIHSSGMTISVTAPKLDDTVELASSMFDKSDEDHRENVHDPFTTYVPDGICDFEHISVPSMVGYAASTGLLPNLGADYCGAFEVLANILDYDYLWTKIRVFGGAYGCGSHISRNGSFGFYSFRDPSANKSLEVFADSHKIKNSLPDAIDNYIIGAYAANAPLLHLRKLADIADGDYFSGISKDDRMRILTEILGTTRDSLISLVDKLKPVEGKYTTCIISAE